MVARTTLTALQDDMTTRVEAITPTLRASQKWGHTESEEPSPALRRFRLDFEVPEADDTIVCGGASWLTMMHVVTSYTGLPQREVAPLIWQDMEDLWVTLGGLTDDGAGGGVQGLIHVERPTWEPEREEAGVVWGRIILPVLFLAKDT